MVVSLILALLQSVRATQAAHAANQQAAIAEAQTERAQAQALRAETVRGFLVDLFESAKEVLPRDQRPTPAQLVATARTKLDQDSSMSERLKADLLLVLVEVSLANDDVEIAVALLDRHRALASFATDPEIDRLWAAGLRAQVAIKRDQAEQVVALLAPFSDEIAKRTDRRIVEILEHRLQSYMHTSHRAEALRDAELLARRVPQITPALAPGDAIYYSSIVGVTLSLQGDHAGALPILEAAIARWRAHNLPRDSTYTVLLNVLGVSKAGLGAPDLGAAELSEVLALRREILSSPHEGLIAALRNYGMTMRRQGNLAAAEQAVREAADMAADLYGPNHRNAMAARSTLATVIGVSGIGKHDEAIAIYRELIAICNGVPEQQDNVGCITYQHNLAHQLEMKRDYQAAMAALDGAEATARRLFDDDHFQVGTVQMRKGVLLFEMNRPEEALAAMAEGERRYVGGGQASHSTLWSLQFSRARALRLIGRRDEAMAASSAAQALIAKQTTPNSTEADRGGLLHALLLAERGDLAAARELAAKHRKAFPHRNWRADEALVLRRIVNL
jgi:eukaryotic-like serine/threonine-protein kinase